ncbi:MAG: GNAT family N-acetyltransferase [Nitrososphaerales archaeon]
MKSASSGSQTHFKNLLKNENSFDGLFCNKKRLVDSTIYYNANFSDDPVFNHIILDDVLLNHPAEIESALLAAIEGAESLSLPATLFVEDFWENSKHVQAAAIDSGFRIIEQMKILSKQVRTKSKGNHPHGIHVRTTTDIDEWNNVFSESYVLPHAWNEELLKRERSIVDNQLAILLLATLDETPAGCMLLREEPKGLIGVYCVGTVPKMRSKGVARAMMDASEEAAREADCKEVVLQTVASDNVTPMYLRLGYEQLFQRNVLQRM